MRRGLTSTQPWRLTNNGAGAFLTTPDAARWDSGNESAMVVELWLRMADWTPAGGATIARHGFTDGNLSWSLEVQASGRPRANFYDLGTLATRVGAEATVAPNLIDGRAYGLRFHMLSDIFGVASAYTYMVNRGGGWQELGTTATAALVGSAFDSTEEVRVGEPVEVEDIYALRVWNGAFSPSQIGRAPNLDAYIGRRAQPGVASWADLRDPTVTWTVGAAQGVRSDLPSPYARR